jgi:hypothetical protein
VPRQTRLQYENAIYHIITRGDGRRRLFHDARHYERFTEGLAAEVDRCGWVVIAYRGKNGAFQVREAFRFLAEGLAGLEATSMNGGYLVNEVFDDESGTKAMDES